MACENPLAPDACGPIPVVTVHVGETSRVNACFNDPNGDMLNYTVSSSNPSVATASIASTAITVTGVAPGSATVTLTARDPGGLQGQQGFAVTVPNRAPQPNGTPPNVTVRVGDAATVDAAQYFADPDREPLTYAASLSDAEVAGVSVAGSLVTVTAEAKGSATVTITARDPAGLTATQSFRFTVPNRLPLAVGTLEPQTVEVGQMATLDVADAFSDPDGDALTYTAVSSMPVVARTSVSGSAVTITAAGPGTAIVTITASDDERATATQQVSVTVPQPNRPPRRAGSIPAQTVEVGQRATMNASQYFSDPDGDSLTYAASSSNGGVAGASVSGPAVTITAVSPGSATITVTATDAGDLAAQQSFVVTVPTRSNRAPQAVGTIPDLTVSQGETTTLNVSSHFSDPDGDSLTYSAATSNSGVTSASVSGADLTLAAAAAGTATITVTGTDAGGLAAQQSFVVTVSTRSNRAPQAVGTIPDLTVSQGETTTLNVSSHFSDPDGDSLTYSAATSNSGVASASVSGAELTLAAAAAGTATITVTGTDAGGLAAQQSFALTVSTRSNRAPQAVGTIPDLIPLEDTAHIELFKYFDDPDGDVLTYLVESSESTVAFGYVTASDATVAAAGGGIATLTVAARDPGGLSARHKFRVAVGDEAPDRSSTIPDLTLAVGDTASLDASAFFYDRDGDELTYSARIRRGTAASVLALGSTVAVRAVSSGSATMVVEASDGTHTYSQWVDVTVTAIAPPGSARYDRQGTTIVLNWSASAGATHYNIYHSDFTPECRFSSRGRPLFCDQLATNVQGTTYTHTNPRENRDHYYWIVACKMTECSRLQTVGTPLDFWVAVGGAGDNWLAIDLHGLHADRLQLYRSTAAAGPYTPIGGMIETKGQWPVRYLDDALRSHATYHYEARACNGAECTGRSEAAGRTEAAGPVAIPPEVSRLTGRKIPVVLDTDDALIEWVDVPEATHYRVYQEGRFETTIPAPVNRYRDRNTNTSFGAFIATEYQVLACNKAGCSSTAATVLVR